MTVTCAIQIGEQLVSHDRTHIDETWPCMEELYFAPSEALKAKVSQTRYWSVRNRKQDPDTFQEWFLASESSMTFVIFLKL